MYQIWINIAQIGILKIRKEKVMCYKGTLNSMSYLEPISKWARLFSFLFRT